MAKGNVENRQEIVLDVWLAHPAASFDEIAKLAGVSTSTFERYRADPNFMAKYEARCRTWFKSLQSLALNTMMDAAAGGNIQAAKYLLDGNNYAATQKIDVTANDIKITIGGDEDDE